VNTPRIRSATLADANAIAAIYAPYVSDTVISFELQPPSAAEMAQRLEKCLSGHAWLVAEDSHRILGYAYASEHRPRPAYRWSVDVAIYLAPDVQRLGIGRRLYLSLFEQLRALGYINAYAGIALPNPASVGLHEAVGFSPLGVYRHVGYKFNAWHDVGRWQLTLQTPPVAPRQPGVVE
jgi:L-amino acid N-acyltransferase YncA